MWVLPSRGRPRNVVRLLCASLLTGMATKCCLRLDDDDPMLGGYISINFPPNWTVYVGKRKMLSSVYNELYDRQPKTPWWGFIADDVVPRTNFWDNELIKVAGNDGMAVPSGGEGTPHFVIGGDLARSMGWLALPGLDRIYIDTVWKDIATSRGVLHHVPEVTLQHLHFSNAGALVDETYKKHHKDRDKVVYKMWSKAFNSSKGEEKCHHVH